VIFKPIFQTDTLLLARKGKGLALEGCQIIDFGNIPKYSPVKTIAIGDVPELSKIIAYMTDSGVWQFVQSTRETECLNASIELLN